MAESSPDNTTRKSAVAIEDEAGKYGKDRARISGSRISVPFTHRGDHVAVERQLRLDLIERVADRHIAGHFREIAIRKTLGASAVAGDGAALDQHITWH